MQRDKIPTEVDDKHTISVYIMAWSENTIHPQVMPVDITDASHATGTHHVVENIEMSSIRMVKGDGSIG